MTTAADDSAVEDAFEALLAGRPAPEGAAGLAAFTEAVRDSATSPGRPNAALAELLATGLLVDQSSPSARTARSAGTAPSRASRVRIRRRFAMFFPALLAKLLSAGAVAQAATGATVVVVAFAGAGAVGVLPDPVQETFTSIVSDEAEVPVEEEAPVQVPVEEAPVEEAPVEEAPVDEPLVEETEEQTPEEVVSAWMTAPIEGSFGNWVSGARHDPELLAAIEETGHNFGFYVSQRAKNKGLTAQDLAEEGVDLEELAEDGTVVETSPQAETPEAEVEETEPTTQERGNRGNGNGRGGSNGNGNGNGNAGGNGGGNGNGHN
jgi:uncharacterized membrane protein YgcG